MKKIKFLIFSGLVFLGIVGVTNVATAASQTVYAHYRVAGSGKGISSGKSNGVWHYLNKNRKITLKVTKSTGGRYGECTLKRSNIGFDQTYGTVSTSVGTHTFKSKTNVTSGSYYLEFYGGNPGSSHTIRGVLHD